jgi:ribosomal protein S18 acetylase RimI-like enzyme
VNVRPATAADEKALRALWEEFEVEVPEREGFAPETWTEEWQSLRDCMEGGAVFLAQDDDGAIGLLEASGAEPARWHVETVYVRPRARRQGVATALLRACAASARDQGVSYVSLGVLTANEPAGEVWRRLGFVPVEVTMGQPLEALAQRLADEPAAPSRASTHIQTDDRVSVERALARFVPRLGEPDVRDAAEGWIRVADPALDSDRDTQSRLAKELSDSLGAVVVALALEHEAVVRFRLYERGSMVDEYLSVPSYYGPMATGDELALAANPTLVARLTGADRDEVRRIARTADSPSELPPPAALYAQIAELMGLEP